MTRILPVGLKQVQLRRRARKARIAGNWAGDANYRRQLCSSRFAQPRDWIQYGHALKELGFFDEAETAYRTAQRLAPADPEPALQLGHLLKVADRFDPAIASFQQALDLGYRDAAEVAREFERIRLASVGTVFRETTVSGAKSGIHFYLSSPNKPFSEGSRSNLSAGLGHSDYSYAFAMRGFVEALEALAIPFTIIESPEFIVDIRERSDAAVNVHFAFYPPERMRLLKGAWNIACFAWEFERLRNRGESTSYHAFADQGTMLGLVDEIWVPSSEGARVVADVAEQPVKHVAAPVLSNHRPHPRRSPVTWQDLEHQTKKLDAVQWQPLAIVPRIQGTMNGMAVERQGRIQSILRSMETEGVPRIFVTVLNVHDYRKQLRPLIEGFLTFTLEQPDAVLLVKMTTPDRGKLTINEFILMDQISNAGDLVPPMVSNRIWITDDILTRAEMNALYDLAEFYICTPYAEGQNLPLIEAMARGCVPVTPDHSAMRDYIDGTNAVVVPYRSVLAEPRITTRYGMWGIQANVISADAAADAMTEAVMLDAAARAAKSANAAATVRDMFGLDRFQRHVADLEKRLTEVAK